MLHDIGNVAANQCRIVPNRKWLADEIALHRVAALLGEKAELLLRLYALGDDRHFQRMTEIDHGPDDCRRLRIAAEIARSPEEAPAAANAPRRPEVARIENGAIQVFSV